MPKIYPTIIQPKCGYRHFMSIRHLIKAYPKLIASRRCDLQNESEIFVESEKGNKILSSEALGNCLGLSLNLLGGLFDIQKHNLFRPTHNAPVQNIWNGNEEYEVKIEDFEIKGNEKIIFYFLVSDWMNFTFPYNKGIKDINEYNKIRDKTNKLKQLGFYDTNEIICGEFKKDSQVELKARTKINHCPTLMNYWHVQLDSYMATEQTALNNESKPTTEKKRIIRELRVYLQHKYLLKADIDYCICSKYYLKKRNCKDILNDFLRYIYTYILSMKVI